MRLRAAKGIGVELDEGTVYTASLPDGPIVVLEGIAALIWTEAIGTRRQDVARAVADRTDKGLREIRGEVNAFIDEMLSRGMLIED